MNAREFQQRIREIVARENAERAARKKPPASDTSTPFRQRIQEIVQGQQREAIEAARKPPASETRKAKLRRNAK